MNDLALRVEEERSRRYMQQVREGNATRRAQGREVVVARSSAWTREGLPAVRGLEVSPFVGRVALDREVEVLGFDSFYVAAASAKNEQFQVVSWAARAARLFFVGVECKHQWAGSCVGTRSFTHNGSTLTGYADSFFDGRTSELFSSTSQARVVPVPKAPGASRSRFLNGSGGSAPVNTATERLAAIPTQRRPREQQHVRDAGMPRAKTSALSSLAKPMRAENLVKQSLLEPRRSSMSAVLGTLQAEQYATVTASPRRSWIVHGHPGTGKTVIGTHRAAWLVDAEGGRLGGVLFVCPTDAHVRHVSGVMAELDQSGRVVTKALASLLDDVSGLRPATQSAEGEYFDTAWETWLFLGELSSELASLDPGRNRIERLETAYEWMRMIAGRRDGTDEELATWMGSLPTWSVARHSTRHRPLLAALALQIDPMRAHTVHHIIVDEAQDVRPLEWGVLSQYKNAADVTWTLLGDLDQRRTHLTPGGWSSVADYLRTMDPGSEITARRLTRGYRSTTEILRYAAQLLPRGQQTDKISIQQGELPVVRRVGGGENLASVAVEAAIDLGRDQPERLTAIIAIHTNRLIGQLRTRGWVASAPGAWKNPEGNLVLQVLEPASARGVEFDHVVVVEPDDFPRILDGPGLLYTSLTRANRNLTVVHQKALPRALRQRAAFTVTT